MPKSRIKQSPTTPRVSSHIQQDFRIHLGLSRFSQSMWQVGWSSTSSRKCEHRDGLLFLLHSLCCSPSACSWGVEPAWVPVWNPHFVREVFFDRVFTWDSSQLQCTFSDTPLSPAKTTYDSSSSLSLGLVTRLHECFFRAVVMRKSTPRWEKCSSHLEGPKKVVQWRNKRCYVILWVDAGNKSVKWLSVAETQNSLFELSVFAHVQTVYQHKRKWIDGLWFLCVRSQARLCHSKSNIYFLVHQTQHKHDITRSTIWAPHNIYQAHDYGSETSETRVSLLCDWHTACWKVDPGGIGIKGTAVKTWVHFGPPSLLFACVRGLESLVHLCVLHLFLTPMGDLMPTLPGLCVRGDM